MEAAMPVQPASAEENCKPAGNQNRADELQGDMLFRAIHDLVKLLPHGIPVPADWRRHNG